MVSECRSHVKVKQHCKNLRQNVQIFFLPIKKSKTKKNALTLEKFFANFKIQTY